jgi:hypothetical protein
MFKKIFLITMLFLAMSVVAIAAPVINDGTCATLDSSYSYFSVRFIVDTSSITGAMVKYYLYIRPADTTTNYLTATYISPKSWVLVDSAVQGALTSADTLTYSFYPLVYDAAKIFYYRVIATDSANADTSVDSTTIVAFPYTTSTYNYEQGWTDKNTYHNLWTYDQSGDSNYYWLKIKPEWKQVTVFLKAMGLDNNHARDTLHVTLYTREFGNRYTMWDCPFSTDTLTKTQAFSFGTHAFAADTIGGTGASPALADEIGVFYTVSDSATASKVYILDTRKVEAVLRFR